jgi:hypothetical protein
MNWDDPAERLALIERVGADEYNRLFKEHRRSSVVATVNGYGISLEGTSHRTVLVESPLARS